MPSPSEDVPSSSIVQDTTQHQPDEQEMIASSLQDITACIRQYLSYQKAYPTLNSGSFQDDSDLVVDPTTQQSTETKRKRGRPPKFVRVEAIDQALVEKSNESPKERHDKSQSDAQFEGRLESQVKTHLDPHLNAQSEVGYQYHPEPNDKIPTEHHIQVSTDDVSTRSYKKQSVRERERTRRAKLKTLRPRSSLRAPQQNPDATTIKRKPGRPRKRPFYKVTTNGRLKNSQGAADRTSSKFGVHEVHKSAKRGLKNPSKAQHRSRSTRYGLRDRSSSMDSFVGTNPGSWPCMARGSWQFVGVLVSPIGVLVPSVGVYGHGASAGHDISAGSHAVVADTDHGTTIVAPGA